MSTCFSKNIPFRTFGPVALHHCPFNQAGTGLCECAGDVSPMSGFERIQVGEAFPKTVEDRTGRLVIVEKGVTDTLLLGLP
jgi:hypothetical protein